MEQVIDTTKLTGKEIADLRGVYKDMGGVISQDGFLHGREVKLIMDVAVRTTLIYIFGKQLFDGIIDEQPQNF